MAPRLYTEMTEREAIMRRALDRIAAGADPTLKPGHADYMSKASIMETALKAVREYDATFAGATQS